MQLISNIKKMPIQLGSIRLFSVAEVSEALNVTAPTIRRYLKEHKIKGRKVGCKWFVTEDSLRNFFGVFPEHMQELANVSVDPLQREFNLNT